MKQQWYVEIESAGHWVDLVGPFDGEDDARTWQYRHEAELPGEVIGLARRFAPTVYLREFCQQPV